MEVSNETGLAATLPPEDRPQSGTNVSQAILQLEIEQDTPCNTTGLPSDQQGREKLEKLGLILLALQQLSSSWDDRTAEFAFFLFLSELFITTLLPSSIYGFFTTGAAVLLSAFVGGLSDRYAYRVWARRGWGMLPASGRLRFSLVAMLIQKAAGGLAAGFFVILFASPTLRQAAETRASGLHGELKVVYTFFSFIIFLSCCLSLSTTAIQISVQREWVVLLSSDNSDLKRLNAIMRRIDLFSKLVAPLLVSLLTTTAGYTFTAAFIAGFSICSAIWETIMLNALVRRYRILHTPRQRSANAERPESATNPRLDAGTSEMRNSTREGQRTRHRDRLSPTHFLSKLWRPWLQFIVHPVFPASLSVSFLYLTILNFDGNLLTYLKWRGFSDSFLAAMRGVTTMTGLVGTWVFPWLSGRRRFDAVRAGSWLVWSEVFALVPVLVYFSLPENTIPTKSEGMRGPTWASLLLFIGMAVSRIGLWGFDLAQLQVFQEYTIEGRTPGNDNANRLMGQQLALQNTFGMAKYIMIIALPSPTQFSVPVFVSFGCVFGGAATWMAFVRKERGHILHVEKLKELFKIH